jgi:hypothetical protein
MAPFHRGAARRPIVSQENSASRLRVWIRLPAVGNISGDAKGIDVPQEMTRIVGA